MISSASNKKELNVSVKKETKSRPNETSSLTKRERENNRTGAESLTKPKSNEKPVGKIAPPIEAEIATTGTETYKTFNKPAAKANHANSKIENENLSTSSKKSAKEVVLANDPIDTDRSKNENGSIEMDRCI